MEKSAKVSPKNPGPNFVADALHAAIGSADARTAREALRRKVGVANVVAVNHEILILNCHARRACLRNLTWSRGDYNSE